MGPAVQRITLAEAEAKTGKNAQTIAMRHQAWRVGNLSWRLHEGQKKAAALIRNGKARRYVLEIARRWGKSYWLLVEAFEVCLKIPKARVPYAASTETSVKEFILPIALGLIETAPDELRPELVGNEVRFKNGSRIVFQGCEDRVKANRLRGPAAHLAIVDEAGFIPSSVLKYVVKSIFLFQLVTTRGMMLIASSPPETPAHEFTKMAIEAEGRGAWMHATIFDAPHLSREAIQEAIDESGGADTVEWQREGLAMRIVDPSSAIVPEFTKLEPLIVIEEYSPSEYLDHYIVGDLGFVDLAFVLFADWDFANSMVTIIGEWSEPRVETDELQREVDKKAKALWGDAPIFKRKIDATARERADMVNLQELDPTAENTWQAVNNQERDVLVNRLRIATKRLRYRIHKSCVKLIAHLRSGTWNEQRTSFARTDGFGHFDGVAALSYLERHVDRSHNPTPPLRATHYSQIVPKSASLPPGSDADRRLRLANAFQRPRKT